MVSPISSKGEFDKAVADYTEAIRLEPELRRGVPRPRLRPRAQRRPEHGLADLNMAVRLAPKDAAAYASRGKAYSEMGDWDRAIADYGRAIELEPQGAGRSGASAAMPGS